MLRWVGRVRREEGILWARRPELQLLMLLRITLRSRVRRIGSWKPCRRVQSEKTALQCSAL